MVEPSQASIKFGAFGAVSLPRTSHHKQLSCLTLRVSLRVGSPNDAELQKVGFLLFGFSYKVPCVRWQFPEKAESPMLRATAVSVGGLVVIGV